MKKTQNTRGNKRYFAIDIHREYIETGLHYRRDVTLREDATRITIGNMGAVIAALNNLTLALIKQTDFYNAAQGRRWFAGHLDRTFDLLTTANHRL